MIRDRGRGPVIFDSLDKPNADQLTKQQRPIDTHMVYLYLSLVITCTLFIIFVIVFVMRNLEYKIQVSESITERNIAIIIYNIIPYALVLLVFIFLGVCIYYIYVHAQRETRVNIYQAQMTHRALNGMKRDILDAIVPVMMEEMRNSLLRTVTTYTPTNTRTETTVMADDSEETITADDDAGLIPMSALLDR
jgi:uncharacterized membrane protein YqhA